MSRPHNLLYTFAIIVALLAVIACLSVVTHSFVGKHMRKQAPKPNQIYEATYEQNTTYICPPEQTCNNKTLWWWYIPWLRFSLWKTFEESIEEVIQEEETVEDVELPVVDNKEEVEKEEEREEVKAESSKEEKKSEYIASCIAFTMMVGVLVLSSSVACLDVVKERLKAPGDVPGEARAGRRCSLAEFRINRHLRKESQQLHAQQVDQTSAKVTQPLVHQGSLDRAISNMAAEVRTPLIRRSSVPAHLVGNIGNSQPIDKIKKQQSCDISGDELTPEMRRKSRHFIRRH